MNDNSMPNTASNASSTHFPIENLWTMMPISSVDKVDLCVSSSMNKKAVDLKIFVTLPFVVDASQLSLNQEQETTLSTIDTHVKIGFHNFEGNLPSTQLDAQTQTKVNFTVPLLGENKLNSEKPVLDYFSLAKSPVVHHTVIIPGIVSGMKRVNFRIR